MSDDVEERSRVYSRIAPVILAFRDAHRDREFHVEDLRRFVRSSVPEIAPDSPGRILRELRLQGHLDYIVVNRRASLYRFCLGLVGITMNQPFAWSYSQLKNAETCLKRYFHYNVEKDVVEPESQELVEGNQLHAHFHARLSKGTPLPLGYGQHEATLAKLAAAPGTLYSEQKLALTNEFKPVAFFGKGVWFRTVIDATVVREDHSQASIFDWKTGRIREDPTQLQLMAATMFHHDPKVERVKAGLVFVNQDHVERAEFVRGDVTEIWGEILPRVKALQVAREKQEFPPKPSGLCKRYCAVTSCPYHGR